MAPSTPSRAFGDGDHPDGNGPPSRFPPLTSFEGDIGQQLVQAAKWRHDHPGSFSSPNTPISLPSERIDSPSTSKEATRSTARYPNLPHAHASLSSAPGHHPRLSDHRQWDYHQYAQSHNHTHPHQSNAQGYPQPHPTQPGANQHRRPHTSHPYPYGYPHQQAALSNTYGYPQQQPASSNSHGYPPQQAAPSNSYGYPPQQAAPSSSYGYPPQQAALSNTYGYPPQQAAPSSSYGNPQQQPASSSPYGCPQQNRPQKPWDDCLQPYPPQLNTQSYSQFSAQSHPYSYLPQYAVQPSEALNVPSKVQGYHQSPLTQPNASYRDHLPSVPNPSTYLNSHTTVCNPRPGSRPGLRPGPVIARTPTPIQSTSKSYAVPPQAVPTTAASPRTPVADKVESAVSQSNSAPSTTPQLVPRSPSNSSLNSSPARPVITQSAPCSPLQRFSIDAAAVDGAQSTIGKPAPRSPGELSSADTPIGDAVQPTIGKPAPRPPGERSSADTPVGDADQPAPAGKKNNCRARNKAAKKDQGAHGAPPVPTPDSSALNSLSDADTGDNLQGPLTIKDTVTPTPAQPASDSLDEPSSSTIQPEENTSAEKTTQSKNEKPESLPTIEVSGGLAPRTHHQTSQIACVGPWVEALDRSLAEKHPSGYWETGRLPPKRGLPIISEPSNETEQEKDKMTQDKGKRKASEDPESPVAAKRTKHDDSTVQEPQPKKDIIPFPEKPAVQEERNGEIEFHVVNNDGEPNSQIILTHLKCIFQKQLPKMPKDYIARLVYDRTHLSIAIVKHPLEVVGGITFRPFRDREFAEIVFCAISSDQQVKGYGAHLMAHLKDYVKATSPVMHFLTYADNYAIGYFKKQGFTKEITLEKSVWMGYIKDYEGGTIMQCTMLPRVRYLETGRMLLKQRELVLAKIRAVSKSHVVHQPPKQWKNGVKPIDPMTIDAIRNSGWSPEMDELARQPRRGANYNQLLHLLNALQNHQAAWPFLVPVNRDEVQDYYEVIKEPMDLSTMEQKLDADKYPNPEDFLKDSMLIFKNCRQYNSEGTPYTKMANKLEKALWAKVREIPEWSHYEDDLAAKK